MTDKCLHKCVFWVKAFFVNTYIHTANTLCYCVALQILQIIHTWLSCVSISWRGLWGSLNFTVCRPFGGCLRCLPFMIRNLGILPIIILGGPANTGCGDFGDEPGMYQDAQLLSHWMRHGRTCLAIKLIMTFTSHSSQAWRRWPVVWVGLNRSWRLYDVRRRVGSQVGSHGIRAWWCSISSAGYKAIRVRYV